MEKVQYITRSALRRASTIEVHPQTRQRLQELFVNFCLILICLLLICIIVMLLWSPVFLIDLHYLMQWEMHQKEKRTKQETSSTRKSMPESPALGLKNFSPPPLLLTVTIKSTLYWTVIWKVLSQGDAWANLPALFLKEDFCGRWWLVLCVKCPAIKI